MRSFKIDRVAQLEFDEAVAWYEQQEIGLGFEFIEQVDRVVRREFVRRFPYVVISSRQRRCGG